MEKFVEIKYEEIETKKISNFETSFRIAPLDRGFSNTLGNAIRRVLLSSIQGIAPFAIKILNVEHEFQTIDGITEDVVQLILNLKKIKYIFNKNLFTNNQVIKISLKSKNSVVSSKDLILPPGLEIVDKNQYIATVSKGFSLELELFLTSGRGFVTFEENKDNIKILESQIETNISFGKLIAVDSDFSPIVNVSYEAIELNSPTINIEEELILNIKTNGSMLAKDALSYAAHIFISHLQIFSNISNVQKDKIFQEEIIEDKKNNIKDITISSLDFSIRSLNCLKRAGKKNLEDLSKMSLLELENLKNLGKKSIEEIVKKLKEFDITLKEEENNG